MAGKILGMLLGRPMIEVIDPDLSAASQSIMAFGNWPPPCDVCGGPGWHEVHGRNLCHDHLSPATEVSGCTSTGASP